MRRLFLAAFVSACSCGMAGCGPGVDKANWEKCRAGGIEKPDDVIAGCSAIIDAKVEPPGSIAIALGLRGSAYITKQQFDLAISDLDAGIALAPNFEPLYAMRGTAHATMKAYEDAIGDYDKAIELMPDNQGNYGSRGAAKARLGRHEEAIADFTKAISLGKPRASDYQGRGTAYARLNRQREAINDFDQSLRLDPKDAITLNNRCFSRAIANVELEEALADCNKAIELAAQGGMYDSRGFVYLRLGKLDEAIRDFDEAFGQNPKAADALFKRGVAKRRSGDAAGGDADIAAAEAISPEIAKAMADYGVMP